MRAGPRNLFLNCEPKAGWRHVGITHRRIIEDFAQQMRCLLDEAYTDVPVIRLVLDNPILSTAPVLSTHSVAFLHEGFPAPQVLRHPKRLEFHHTPKHGSWLNMADMEFSVPAQAWLRGRNTGQGSLDRTVNANVAERNPPGKCQEKKGVKAGESATLDGAIGGHEQRP